MRALIVPWLLKLTIIKGSKNMHDFKVLLQRIINNEKTQKSLSMIGFDIIDAEVRVLANALEKNEYIEELNLGHNQIGDEGAKALAKSLTVNAVLNKLDISHNKIGVIAVKALEKASKEKPTINLNLKGQAPSDAFKPTDGSKITNIGSALRFGYR